MQATQEAKEHNLGKPNLHTGTPHEYHEYVRQQKPIEKSTQMP